MNREDAEIASSGPDVLDAIDMNSQLAASSRPTAPPPASSAMPPPAVIMDTEEILHGGCGSYRLSARRSSILKFGEVQMERRPSRRVSWAKTFQCKERLSDGTSVVTSQELIKYGPELPPGGLPTAPVEPVVVKVDSAAKSRHLQHVLNTFYDKSNDKDHKTVVNTMLNKFNIEIDASDPEKNSAKVYDMLQNNVFGLEDLKGLLLGGDQNRAPLVKCAETTTLLVDEINTTTTRRFLDSTHVPLDQSAWHDPLLMTEKSPIKPMDLSPVQAPKTIYEVTMMSVNSEKPETVQKVSLDMSLEDVSPPAQSEVHCPPPETVQKVTLDMSLEDVLPSAQNEVDPEQKQDLDISLEDVLPSAQNEVECPVDSEQKQDLDISLEDVSPPVKNEVLCLLPEPNKIGIMDISIYDESSPAQSEAPCPISSEPEPKQDVKIESKYQLDTSFLSSDSSQSVSCTAADMSLGKTRNDLKNETEAAEPSLSTNIKTVPSDQTEEAKLVEQQTNFNLSMMISNTQIVCVSQPEPAVEPMNFSVVQENKAINVDLETTKVVVDDSKMILEDTKMVVEDTKMVVEDTKVVVEGTEIGLEDTKVEVIEITKEEITGNGDYEPTQPLLLGKSATQILRDDDTESSLDKNQSAKRPSPSRGDGSETCKKIMRLEPKTIDGSTLAQINCKLQKFAIRKPSLGGFGAKTFVCQQTSKTERRPSVATSLAPVTKVVVKPVNNAGGEGDDSMFFQTEPTQNPVRRFMSLSLRDKLLAKISQQEEQQQQAEKQEEQPQVEKQAEQQQAEKQEEQQQQAVERDETDALPNSPRADESSGGWSSNSSSSTQDKMANGSGVACLSPIKPPPDAEWAIQVDEIEDDDHWSFDDEVTLNLNHDFTQRLHELSLDKESLPVMEISMYQPLACTAVQSDPLSKLGMFEFFKQIDLLSLNARVQSVDEKMLVIRYLYSTMELRIHFGAPVKRLVGGADLETQHREIVAMDLVDLIHGKPLPERVMRGVQDRPLYDGDSYLLMFNEETRPLLLLGHDCLVTRFEEKRQFFKKTFTDTSKLPELVHEFSMLVTPAKELANELLYLFHKKFVELLPKDSDGCFRMAVELLGVRYNSPIQLYISVDHLAYPDKVIRPTIKVPEKDLHLYPLDLFSEALLMIKPCQFQYRYLTKLIWAAGRFIMALRYTRKKNKKRAQQSEAIRKARFTLDRC